MRLTVHNVINYYLYESKHTFTSNWLALYLLSIWHCSCNVCQLFNFSQEPKKTHCVQNQRIHVTI